MRSLIDMAAAPRRLHRPVAVAEPLHGVPDDREAVVDVPARLEAGPQDHVLPALTAGDADQPDERRSSSSANGRGPTGGGTTTSLPARDTEPAAGDEVTAETPRSGDDVVSDDEAVACSLENPESCEACQ